MDPPSPLIGWILFSVLNALFLALLTLMPFVRTPNSRLIAIRQVRFASWYGVVIPGSALLALSHALCRPIYRQAIPEILDQIDYFVALYTKRVNNARKEKKKPKKNKRSCARKAHAATRKLLNRPPTPYPSSSYVDPTSPLNTTDELTSPYHGDGPTRSSSPSPTTSPTNSKIPVLIRSPPGSPPLSPSPFSNSTSPKLLKVSPNSRIPIAVNPRKSPVPVYTSKSTLQHDKEVLHNRVRELRTDNIKPLEIRGTPSTPVLRLGVLPRRLFSPNTMAKISTQRPRAA
ncbi:hypothetical protein BJ742DRAFT_779694 [Cladochytrium replicatum]|nr:hypothetical protein BJ742DRAFT_779694 [Cladochytrium replicatum]